LTNRLGKYTVKLEEGPSLLGFAAVVSKTEGAGPLAPYFDKIEDDELFGAKSWEQAESQMQKESVELALGKAGVPANDVDYVFAGDLLNQCIGSHYGLRDLGIPFMGVYGACSTMAESLALAALFVENKIAGQTLAVTSSHFCAAERQFRFPLEYGGTRTPTAQRTVTGAGAVLVGAHTEPPYVRAVTTGTIEDMGVTDINNMGAAMAPAAAWTIKRFFDETSTGPDNYDLILTGDLASTGSELLRELMTREGIDLKNKHNDCGLIIYDKNTQDVNSGGSGCGCSASVLCAYVIPQMKQGKLNNVLFCATGALMSPLAIQQGESIPGIAHLIHLSTQ